MELETLNETERRVLGNLSEPRSLANLTRVLLNDERGPFWKMGYEKAQKQVSQTLESLVDSGDVTDIGAHSESKTVLSAVKSSDEAIELPAQKAKRLGVKLERGRDGRLDHPGSLFIMSKAGLDRITA